MSMNCDGCKYDGFIMLGDKKVSYCKYFKETKQNMDRTTHISYYPFQHGYCLHKTEMKYDREALDLAIEALRGDFHCPKCGTIVRNGRQYHDLVYRGEAEVDTPTNTSTDLISRQAAIEEIKNATTITGWNKYASQEEIVDDVERQLRRLFVGAIESLPPVEPKPVCEDCISRETVMDVISNCEHICDVYGELKKLIENIPSVEPTNKAICEHFYKGYCSRFEDGCFWQCQKDPKRPKGRWINECENGHGFWIGTCDQCGKENHVGNFCPNCGADMKGNKE